MTTTHTSVTDAAEKLLDYLDKRDGTKGDEFALRVKNLRTALAQSRQPSSEAVELPHLHQISSVGLIEPVAEIVDCPIMGQQKVREIDGRWKFLRNGEKLYAAPPRKYTRKPLTKKEIADLTAMVWGAPAADDDLKKAEFIIRAYESILNTGERPCDPVDGGRFIDVPGAFRGEEYAIAAIKAAHPQPAAPAGPIGCEVDQFSSRACEQGTKGCVIQHAAAPVGGQGEVEAGRAWHHIDDVIKVVELMRAGKWGWGENTRCKYIEVRIDTRDGGCIIKDRHGVRITPEQLSKQPYGIGGMPWEGEHATPTTSVDAEMVKDAERFRAFFTEVISEEESDFGESVFMETPKTLDDIRRGIDAALAAHKGMSHE